MSFNNVVSLAHHDMTLLVNSGWRKMMSWGFLHASLQQSTQLGRHHVDSTKSLRSTYAMLSLSLLKRRSHRHSNYSIFTQTLPYSSNQRYLSPSHFCGSQCAECNVHKGFLSWHIFVEKIILKCWAILVNIHSLVARRMSRRCSGIRLHCQ